MAKMKYSGRKKRYAYLDDYKKGVDGKYVYYGRHCIVKDNNINIKNYKLTAGIADILLAALFILGGLMDAGIIWSTWYVLIPYMLNAIMIFLFVWKNVSFMTEKYPIKEYMYKKTVMWFKPTLILNIIFEIISVIGTAVCMVVYSGTEYIRMTGCYMYLGTVVVSGIICVLAVKRLCIYKWILDPSEELEQ